MLLGVVLLIVGLLMVVVGLVAHGADHILWAGVAVGVVGLVCILVAAIDRGRVAP